MTSQPLLSISIPTGPRLLLQWFDRMTRREYRESWFSWHRIAEELHRSVRTIQRWATILRSIGLLSWEACPSLNSGVRHLLLFRGPRPTEQARAEGQGSLLPPYPPSARSLPSEEPPDEPPPPRPHSPRSATKAEVEAVVQKACKHFGSFGWWLRRKVTAAARVHTLRRVEAAIDLGIRLDARSWSWVEVVLEDWQEHGMPKDITIRDTKEEREARIRHGIELLARKGIG